MPDLTPGERSRWREELSAPINRKANLRSVDGNTGRRLPEAGRDWIRDCRIKLLADLLREQFGWGQEEALIAARRCIESRTKAGQ